MNRTSLRRGALAAAALSLACSGPAAATDHTIAGKVHIIKPAKLAKMIAPGSFTIPAPASAGDPTANGGNLQVVDTADFVGLTTALPSGQWIGLGNPAGSKGYKYKGAGTIADPCKLVLVKSTIIKFLCRDDGALDPPLGGNSAITLSLGADNYCAEFGGTLVKNHAVVFKRKDAPAPGACFVGPFQCPGCNNHSFHGFTTANLPGDCGDIVNAAGTVVANVACAGLYTGGGFNNVPLPYAVPDLTELVTAFTTCTGPVVTLGPTTSASTGSSRNCTSAGCLFGAPLPLPNPSGSPTSVCVVNVLSTDVSGTLDCGTGATSLSAALASIVHLTGDTATDPMHIVPGIQPCPICSSGSCFGGPNDGDPCTPGTSTLGGPAYPTSQDCPPLTAFTIGTLPINFALSSGTVTWSGTTATNDTGSTAGSHTRDFTGYCRDSDFSSDFESPPRQCWENGMAVGPPCAGQYETCEQRNNGAFGQAGTNNRTITAIGSSMTIIGGPSNLTLVSIFSIPPTFDGTVDGVNDLPGPGTVALPGISTSCASVAACP